jgi:hypothetical protein
MKSAVTNYMDLLTFDKEIKTSVEGLGKELLQDRYRWSGLERAYCRTSGQLLRDREIGQLQRRSVTFLEYGADKKKFQSTRISNNLE